MNENELQTEVKVEPHGPVVVTVGGCAWGRLCFRDLDVFSSYVQACQEALAFHGGGAPPQNGEEVSV